MLRKLALAAAAFALFGCASINPIPFQGPNGRTAYSMECSGGGRTLQACLVKAGELCGSGYTIVEQSTRSGGAFTTPMITGGVMVTPINRQSLSIECK